MNTFRAAIAVSIASAIVVALSMTAGAVPAEARTAGETIAASGATHSISGRATDAQTAGRPGVSGWATAYEASTGYSRGTATADASGAFTISGLADGQYRVQFSPDNFSVAPGGTGLAPRWWGGTPLRSQARILTVSGADATADIGLVAGASISGTVSTREWLTDNHRTVVTYLKNPDGTWEKGPSASADNTYFTIVGIPDAPLVVYFGNYTSDVHGAQDYSTFYWPDQPDRSKATIIQAGAGQRLTGFDVWLGPWQAHAIGRISGADRFEAAANISASQFQPGVPAVFVADGTNYPDALSAGPLAVQFGGPVLLVKPGQIPTPIAAELARLRPQQIFVVGGPNSVNPTTYSQLSGYAPQITRISGADRYEVSRALARLAVSRMPPAAEGSSRGQVLFADGRGFADALTAGVFAGSGSGVVVLVDGSASALDAPTAQLLDEIRPSYDWIVGGPNSISLDLEDSIRSHPSHTTRVGGATRYDVSAWLGGFMGMSDAENVYLAQGGTFPDALAGTALAGAQGARLFITPPNCVAGVVLDRMQQIAVPNAVLLGGPSSLGAGVENMQRCP